MQMKGIQHIVCQSKSITAFVLLMEDVLQALLRGKQKDCHYNVINVVSKFLWIDCIMPHISAEQKQNAAAAAATRTEIKPKTSHVA